MHNEMLTQEKYESIGDEVMVMLSLRLIRPLLLLVLLTIGLQANCAAQPVMDQATKLESCKPVSDRTAVEGCWILADSPLGRLPAVSVFWTLDQYPTRDSAQAAATKNSTVVEALGKVWLFTVGDKPPSPQEGRRVTQVGPLPIHPDREYTAQYREAILQPGAVSRTHVHSGPEIFYTESGETCLETPKGKQTGRNGVDIVVPEGEAMELTATGSESRRGIVLVLYASSLPHTTLVSDWKSKGLCKAKP